MPLSNAARRALGSSRSLTTTSGEGRSQFQKVLDVLSAGQFALAGTVEEVIRRKEGRAPRSLLKAARTGIQQRRSFSHLTGNPIVGFGLDVILDPVNLLALVPGGAIPAIAKFAKVPQLIRRVDKATDAVAGLKILKQGIGEAISPTRGLPDEVLKLRNQFLNEYGGAAKVAASNTRRMLEELVPDIKRREFLFNLLEEQPLITDDLAKLSEFNKFFAKLPQNEKRAFLEGKRILKELEEIKLKVGLLTEKRIAGFLKKARIRYVPRRHATKDYTMARLREIEASLESGDTIADATVNLGNVREWMREFDSVTELLGVADKQRIISFYKGDLAGLVPAFLKRRQTPGKVSDLAKMMQAEINLDMAAVLGREAGQVLETFASKRYVEAMLQHLKKKGMLIDKGLRAPPDFRELRGLPSFIDEAFKGVAVPRRIAKEVERVVKGYSNPKFQGTMMELYVKNLNIWKAWTLSIFPSYHLRNLVSNIWNNGLAGMDKPTDIQHYFQATKMQMAAKQGRLGTEKTIRFGGKLRSEKEIYEASQNMRVVGAGEFAGELGESMTSMLHPNNIFKRVTDPANNPALRNGYKFGRAVEDNSRLAHFLWKGAKGASLEDSAASVQKFLFDYQYGLSEFMSKFGRNFAFPFIAWTRFNLPLQAEMLLAQPHKFTAVSKLKRAIEDNFGGPEPEEIYLADWMKHSMKMRTRYNRKKDTYEYFVLDNWWPAADLRLIFDNQRARDELLGMVSPFLKIPPELWFNYNLFQKRTISEFPGQRKRILGVPVKARVEHLLRNVRLLNEIDRTLQVIDSNGWASGIGKILGGRVYPVSFEKQKRYWGFQMNGRIREMKRQRKFQTRQMDEGKRGAAENVQDLDRLIEEASDRLREFK